MNDNQAKITALQPVVLADNRRVTLELEVTGLPAAFSNVMLMPDIFTGGSTPPPKPDPAAATPYPDIELSILNSRRQQIVSLVVVEHKEPHISLTLHLPAADLDEQYTARAEMTYQDEIIDAVEVPFRLHQPN
jgi:hypothetical protein